MFDKILIPIDGSHHAHNSLIRGIELAKIHGSQIEIFHVVTFSEEYVPYVSMNEGIGSEYFSMPPEWIIEYIKNVEQNDEKMLNEALKHAKSTAPILTITTNMETGTAVETIIAEAEKGKFDLIVMGCRGLGGFKELVLGSVSRGVVNGSNIPVLIIK